MGRALLQEGLTEIEPTRGKYGKPEQSWIVHGASIEQLARIGERFGQESVAVRMNGKNFLVFTNGPAKNHCTPPIEGIEKFDTEPQDYYTVMPPSAGVNGFFKYNIDFENPAIPLEELGKHLTDVSPAGAAQQVLKSVVETYHQLLLGLRQRELAKSGRLEKNMGSGQMFKLIKQQVEAAPVGSPYPFHPHEILGKVPLADRECVSCGLRGQHQQGCSGSASWTCQTPSCRHCAGKRGTQPLMQSEKPAHQGIEPIKEKPVKHGSYGKLPGQHGNVKPAPVKEHGLDSKIHKEEKCAECSGNGKHNEKCSKFSMEKSAIAPTEKSAMEPNEKAAKRWSATKNNGGSLRRLGKAEKQIISTLKKSSCCKTCGCEDCKCEGKGVPEKASEIKTHKAPGSGGQIAKGKLLAKLELPGSKPKAPGMAPKAPGMAPKPPAALPKGPNTSKPPSASPKPPTPTPPAPKPPKAPGAAGL
jgi:hypothetical protein